MSYEQILYDAADGIATVTLNRPDRLNAWTRTMEDEVFDALGNAEKDDSVRAVILTGAGRGFCAGADMEALAWIRDVDLSKTDPAEIRNKVVPERKRPNTLPDFQKTYSYFAAVPKPIIAAINGPCVGLGFAVSLYCDIRIASDTAKFGTAFARRGLIAEHGLSWMLPRLVGIANSLDLLFSARMIDAEEAKSMGLVGRVVPQASLMETVRGYASEIVNNVSPRSVGIMKRQVYEALFQTLAQAIDTANDEMFKSFACKDFAEGIAHFLEKRPPKFTGR